MIQNNSIAQILQNLLILLQQIIIVPKYVTHR